MKKLKTLLLVTAVALALPGWSQTPAPSDIELFIKSSSMDVENEALSDAARYAHNAKNWPLVIDLYNQLLATKPYDATYLTRRGDANRALGRYELAIKDGQRALQLEPEHSFHSKRLCRSYLLAYQLAQAQLVCTTALQADGNDSDAAINLGHTYLLQGQVSQANHWYQQGAVLIESEEELMQGALQDFILFEQRGWQTSLVKQARVRFVTNARQWLKDKQPLDELLKQANEASRIKDHDKALQLREQRIEYLKRLLGQNHPSVQLAKYYTVIDQLERADQLFANAQYPQALTLYKAALQIQSQSPQLHEYFIFSTRLLSTNIAKTHAAMGERELELKVQEQIRGSDKDSKVAKLIGRPAGQKSRFANVSKNLFQYLIGVDMLGRALANIDKANEPGNPPVELELTSALGGLHHVQGEYAKAEPLYLRALAIAENTYSVEHPAFGLCLADLAGLYESLGQYAKAEPLYLRALAITEKALGSEHPETGIGLDNLAELYISLSQYAKAEPLLLRALTIAEKSRGPEHPDVGASLTRLAGFFESLGQYAKAEPLYLRTLAIAEKTQSPKHPDIGIHLNNLAGLYRAQGQSAKAELFYLRALIISHETRGPTHPEVGTRLAGLARLYESMNQHAKAEPLYLRALTIAEKVEGAEHPSTGLSLNNLGRLYETLGQNAKAKPLYQRALRIANAAQKPDLQWSVSKNLMTLHAPKAAVSNATPNFLRNVPVAIWHGKQSVNVLQSIRENLKALDKESQQSFLRENQSTYEYLSDLLIESGRLAEAEQVLAMLKDQELKELTRRSGPVAAQVVYTGPEVAFAKTQEALSQAAVATTTELEALKLKRKQGFELSASETARVTELEALAAQQRQAFQTFMAQLQKGLSADPASAQRERDALEKSSRGMQTLMRQAGVGHVGLQYVVTDERLSIIFTLPGNSFARQTNVSRAELNRHIGQLRQALQNPSLDPRPPAQALHEILIAPVAAELAQARAHTLVLSLTDLLRYIPFGVLHDGKQYLVEQYAVSLYTPAGGQGLQKTITKNWQIAGLGLTQAATIADDNNRRFDALPGVGKELSSIVRTSASPKGALPGQISLDPQFTKARFEQALPKFPVLHVASHFQFTPGSEYLSYLVMGDGTRLSLADLKDMDFSNVQLLTLSACDTASGGGRNERGSEVEGLGAAVQLAGAKAVLATLWPVADESTATLMQRFYELRSQDKTNTAVAVQQAQLEMLQGKGTASAAQGAKQRGATANVSAAPAPTQTAALPKLRPYMHDPDKPFAHPYYWAPFILMGNWL